MAKGEQPEESRAQDDVPLSDADSLPVPASLPILPLSGFVVFPGAVGPIIVKNESYARMINEAAVKDRLLGVVLSHGKDSTILAQQDLHPVGTAARILKLMNIATGELSFVCQGICRIHISDFMQQEPHIVAHVSRLSDQCPRSEELDALASTLQNQFARLVDLSPQMPEQLKPVAMSLKEYAKLIYFVAGNCAADLEHQQAILEENDMGERFRKALGIVQAEIHKAELSNKIQSEIAQEMGEQQRQHILRRQLKKIQDELGEKDEQAVEIEALRKKIAEARMPDEAQQAALKEVDRLSMMSPAAAEYTVARTYLDWLIELPWARATEDHLDISQAEQVLNEDHYDLEKVKQRIIEYVAVRKLKQDMKGPILCLYGPPGVGKTSLGRSIARALGRKFLRISLGGVRDEAEIRGHRRTYVGALPGRIIQGIRKAGTNNPVFMLDEIDKLGMDFRGDPSSALLEVLDPEQNNAFSDHYLEVTFNLSHVFFITTANVIESIPPALRDRLEVLDLPGYTDDEKVHIARTYLLARQLKEHGLTPENLQLEEEALHSIIRGYTREAGVRNLEREIATICRRVAKQVAEGASCRAAVSAADLSAYLGKPKFFSEAAERITAPGIATGLAWTPAGGDILFVEATRMAGGKGLTLTGQLGDVMKESAQTALSYVRSNAEGLGIRPDFYEKTDIHMHVPAGAIPKDGPSAGITMACALASLMTGRLVRSDVAMTGEITLRGKVLPVGGIKEKVLAAKRAGLTTVILPKLNMNDLEETPPTAKAGMDFVFVDHIAEAFRLVLQQDEPAPKN